MQRYKKNRIYANNSAKKIQLRADCGRAVLITACCCGVYQPRATTGWETCRVVADNCWQPRSVRTR